MSYANFPPLSIDLKPSCRLQLLLIVSHGAALGAVFCSAVPVLVHMLAVLAIFVSGWHYYVRYGSRSGSRFVYRLQRLADGRWCLNTLAGAYTAQLSTCYSHPGLLILHFVLLSGRRHTLVIAADAADKDHLRRLRWQLRYAEHALDACE